MTVVNVFVSLVILTWGGHTCSGLEPRGWCLLTRHMSHTARIKMDGKLVGYLLLFSPLHYITISGDGDVPMLSLSYLSSVCLLQHSISRIVPYLQISISMELTEQGCPGYLQCPCEGPRPPAASLNTVVVITGFSGRAGMWEVIQLGDWRGDTPLVQLSLSDTQNTPGSTLWKYALTGPKLDNEASVGSMKLWIWISFRD